MTPSPSDVIGRAVADALLIALPGVVDQLAASAGPRAYSVADVADRLDVSTSTVYRLIRDGRLPTVPNLTPPRISAAALVDYLAGVS